MNACLPRTPRAGPSPGPALVELVRVQIERALARRLRYRYVRPRVEREGEGWKVLSPNCSRSLDAEGGDIEIAWLVPEARGRWQLHARDDAKGAWRLHGAGLALSEALVRLCVDPAREFWR